MDVIDRANTTSVLMKQLCKEMHIPTKITHVQFVETFSKLQADSIIYQKELEEKFKEGIKNGQYVVTPSDLIDKNGDLTPEGEKIAQAISKE